MQTEDRTEKEEREKSSVGTESTVLVVKRGKVGGGEYGRVGYRGGDESVSSMEEIEK